MAITEHGKQEVKNAMLTAEVELLKAQKECESKLKSYDDLVKANSCKHEHLRDAGSFTYMQTQCEDCGFTWFD